MNSNYTFQRCLFSTVIMAALFTVMTDCADLNFEKFSKNFADSHLRPKGQSGSFGFRAGSSTWKDFSNNRRGSYHAINQRSTDVLGGQHSIKLTLPNQTNRTGLLTYKIVYKGQSRNLKVSFSYDKKNKVVVDKPQLY